MKKAALTGRGWLVALGGAAAVILTRLAAQAVLEDSQSSAWGQAFREGNVTITQSADGTSVTVTFGRNAGFPINQEVELVAGSAGETNAFVGDLDAAGIEGVQFAVTGDGHTPRTRYLFFTVGDQHGVEYHKQFDVPATAGQTLNNVISMTSADGWVRSGEVPVTLEDLRQALRNVYQIGVRLKAGYPTAGETYTISDFRLQGDGAPAVLRPVITQLANRAQTLRLRWGTEAGNRYTVLRGTDLTKLDDFTAVPEAQNVLADGTILEKDIPIAEGDGQVFFIIRKDQ